MTAPLMLVPDDPGLPAEILRLARNGQMSAGCATAIRQALICPRYERLAVGFTALSLVAFEDHSDPDVAHAIASVLVGLCPNFARQQYRLGWMYRYAAALRVLRDRAAGQDVIRYTEIGFGRAVSGLLGLYERERAIWRSPLSIVTAAAHAGLVPPGDATVLMDACRRPGDVHARALALGVLADWSPDWSAEPEGVAELVSLLAVFAPGLDDRGWAHIVDAGRLAGEPQYDGRTVDVWRAERSASINIAAGVYDEQCRLVTR